MRDLFITSHLPTDAEQFETLLQLPGVRLERIVSFGHPTPEGEWYDQPETEWVVLLQGCATIQYYDQTTVQLRAGTTLLLEPHMKHRVTSTSEDAIWLALFYD